MRSPPARAAALAALLGGAAAAADAPPPEGWNWDLKLGVFLQDVASHNADTSLDPAIAGAVDSFSYKLSEEGGTIWRRGRDRVEQRFLVEYGRIRTRDSAWEDDADRLHYAGTYERSIDRPHLMYLGWEGESAFRGPPPERHLFDPTVAKASTGYGQRYDNWLPEKDSFTWRVGAYVRKRWERGADPYVVHIHTGPEFFTRYDRQRSADVSYYVQAEAYSEFSDLHHLVTDAEAGITAKVGASFSVVVKARAYYEARPRLAPDAAPGYSQWSLRQEALVGLLWTFASARP